MTAASAILCLSREAAESLKANLPPASRRTVLQHYNAVAIDTLTDAPSSWNRDSFRRGARWPDGVVVAVVGFVDTRKRQLELLQAIARLRPVGFHVAIIGGSKDASAWDACHSIVARDGLSVSFHGYQSDVTPWYRAADVVALPSSAEGVPRAILEGAAFGLPAVAFDIPGCREAIISGKTGLLATTMDEFVAALSTLSASPALRARLGQAGRDHIMGSFEARANIKRLQEIYNQVL